MRQKRKERKEKDLQFQISNGNLNFGLKPVRDNPFPSYRIWKLANPEGTFQDYLNEKREFLNENRIDRLAQEQDYFAQDHTRTQTHRPMSENEARRRRLINFED